MPLEALQKLPGTLGAMPAVGHTAHHLGPFPPLDGITQRQLVLDQAPWAVLASELDLAGHDLDRGTTWCPQVLVNNRLHPLRVARLGEERGGETGQAHGRTVVPVSTTVRTRNARFWTSDQTRNSTRDRMAGLRVLPRHFGVAQGGICSSYHDISGQSGDSEPEHQPTEHMRDHARSAYLVVEGVGQVGVVLAVIAEVRLIQALPRVTARRRPDRPAEAGDAIERS
jgi:hypothetical protein